jgi:hypothetical protein
MSIMQLDLSESMRTFVEVQAAQRGCPPDVFVKEILLDYQKAWERACLEKKLDAGLDQLDRGEYQIYSKQTWEEMKGKILRGETV